MPTIQCKQCGKECHKNASAIGRAERIGAPLYCSRACAGLARRRKVQLSTEELRERKRLYDMERRARKHDEICAQKREYYYANRDRILAEHTVYRAKHMSRHVEYCRRPEYKAWKVEYDRRYRAQSDFGEFADAALLLGDIDREIGMRASDYEIRLMNGTINKAQTRRRAL